MVTLDLRPEWLEIILGVLAVHLKDAEVIAYGSRVKKASHDGSDLDLAVRNRQNPLLSVAGLGLLREALRESNLPILVDILDWARIPEHFRCEIERNGVIIYPIPDENSVR